jgi:NAD-dependent SIR2 family protein deacetylase
MGKAIQQLKCQKCGDEKPLDCYEAETGEQADLCNECADKVFGETA